MGHSVSKWDTTVGKWDTTGCPKKMQQYCFDWYGWTKCATENIQPSGKRWERQLFPDGWIFSVAHLAPSWQAKENRKNEERSKLAIFGNYKQYWWYSFDHHGQTKCAMDNVQLFREG